MSVLRSYLMYLIYNILAFARDTVRVELKKSIASCLCVLPDYVNFHRNQFSLFYSVKQFKIILHLDIY